MERPRGRGVPARLRLPQHPRHIHDRARRQDARHVSAFTVAPAAPLYEAPLANALSFYENERDGPEYIPSALRSAPAHLNDENAMTYTTPKANAEGEFKGELPSLGERIDAAGGWWDAGDYLKFVQTTSYAVALQLIGVRDFPAQMGAAAGASDFTDEARFGSNGC